ncbi:Predicted N-acetyltransferase YhbS [Eubacterium ruminantium]|uniref:Predicted N-acetyltransferase YhbS n=2 Tax=Eubacterium ruminantium TaxID=42322 RepID=A0A1T4NHH7_9FIRM|nr:N-acetyltransferase [Eubacterium ruminantium]SCW53662.1 Predicted N-acetyltransferase YhbS [Eubacterium ruminantium]SDM87550.1 Predicted N-acetyltransferase YhbS [Eubacterium ruminantium]SJZ78720.1 Predicted N-acetyltransferase YhbS [Eubacterium ruminantium]
MIDNLIIREETSADYKETELMTMRSFWNKYWPGCTEHFLIRIIRESKDYIPEISRIAEVDGKIVGAVYYTKAWIVDGDARHEIATFGPLAVEPTMEGNDIGGALMRETIKLAKEAGIKAIALMGEPNYYPRFGFKRGAECGITDAQGNTFDALMCLPLSDDFSQVKGKLIESADFEKLEDENRLEEINKEFPVYRKVKVQEGFMQIFEQHLGVVKAIDGDKYMVRYWELLIPAKLSDDLTKEPSVGSDVKFIWNHKGESKITQVFKNLLED